MAAPTAHTLRRTSFPKTVPGYPQYSVHLFVPASVLRGIFQAYFTTVLFLGGFFARWGSLCALPCPFRGQRRAVSPRTCLFRCSEAEKRSHKACQHENPMSHARPPTAPNKPASACVPPQDLFPPWPCHTVDTAVHCGQRGLPTKSPRVGTRCGTPW